MGTWIEIMYHRFCYYDYSVVPLVGTWIEMDKYLKLDNPTGVVPLVGTWIEISGAVDDCFGYCRAPRGHVD